MATYAGDQRLVSVDQSISITIRSEHPMSLNDYGRVLENINKLFTISVRETSYRLRGQNGKKREGELIVEDFKIGSLEILTNPYFQGVIGSLAATAITSVFVHVFRIIRGKPDNNDSSYSFPVGNDVITAENLRESEKKSIAATAPARKDIKNAMKTFGLEITIKFQGKIFEVR